MSDSTVSDPTGLIPLVDLAPWFNGDDEQRRILAADVDVHLRRCGFLVVVNHGIDPTVFSTLRAECSRFFHLPEGYKSTITPETDVYRGWIGAGQEANAATYGIDTPPDMKETFAYGVVDLPDESLRTTNPRWYAGNVWPDDPPGFQPAAEAFWRSSLGLANELLQLFALALDLEEDALLDQCRQSTATGTLNWYWPFTQSAPADNQYRIGPHTDFGTLTILDRQPGMGGLQVLDDDGDWIDAPCVDDSLIVNTGDMLRQWTNDRWCSNEHRVLPPSAEAPDEELISLVFFHEPDAQTIISPLPTCVSEANPARYQPISAMDYLAEKFAALEVG
ncbi:MAG: 2-oxoglutarate and iron-dependent oxygenase domain-containing protein [Actinomycetota bacterium]